ncbi:hypothetical protein JN00_0276 [Metamycoplasma subdolum]|uniref:Uncharacterized protein n=1 Tax=Metamycoplasma subdolum TaxID=92407 RepID=A0A3M0A2G1_9BACT|nr:hypothetical protein [Metamycoplasma subdolum]RMA78634.1 hypothetical protein JN00_0276 [Metamycoplasma subdolum]WPB50764.1 hypothetical protein R9C05_01290 [Metamycoplasma subdolum]
MLPVQISASETETFQEEWIQQNEYLLKILKVKHPIENHNPAKFYRQVKKRQTVFFEVKKREFDDHEISIYMHKDYIYGEVNIFKKCFQFKINGSNQNYEIELNNYKYGKDYVRIYTNIKRFTKRKENNIDFRYVYSRRQSKYNLAWAFTCQVESNMIKNSEVSTKNFQTGKSVYKFQDYSILLVKFDENLMETPLVNNKANPEYFWQENIYTKFIFSTIKSNEFWTPALTQFTYLQDASRKDASIFPAEFTIFEPHNIYIINGRSKESVEFDKISEKVKDNMLVQTYNPAIKMRYDEKAREFVIDENGTLPYHLPLRYSGNISNSFLLSDKTNRDWVELNYSQLIKKPIFDKYTGQIKLEMKNLKFTNETKDKLFTNFDSLHSFNVSELKKI